MLNPNQKFALLQNEMEGQLGDNNSHYIGRLLTIVDASLPKENAKAVKDLVKHVMWEYLQDEFVSVRNLIQMSSKYSIEEGQPIKINIKTNGK